METSYKSRARLFEGPEESLREAAPEARNYPLVRANRGPSDSVWGLLLAVLEWWRSVGCCLGLLDR